MKNDKKNAEKDCLFTYNVKILREKVLKMKFSHVNFDVFEILIV